VKTMATTTNIDLVLPLEKQYAQVLRLAVAGIANRLDFNWEQIEDIKLAVEEAFLLTRSADSVSRIHFNFTVKPDSLTITVINAYLGHFDMQTYEQKYSFFIMTGLMDNVDIIPRNEKHFDLQLIKKIY